MYEPVVLTMPDGEVKLEAYPVTWCPFAQDLLKEAEELEVEEEDSA